MKKVAVVSLIDEHERRQHIDSLFDTYNLDFNYFDAINKSQVEDTLQKHGLSVRSERMSAGEVACYLSHYCLWQQVIANKLPYLMVFEDDIYFSKSAKTLLNNLDWLPNDFDVIKLETMHGRVMINNGVDIKIDHKLCHMKSSHMGMAGYIISQKGAQKLVKMVRELGVDRPVDHIMFERFIEQKNSEVYQVNPALCIQDKVYNEQSTRFGSCLEEERQARPVIKLKLSVRQKINRELIRFWHQLYIAERYRTLSLILKGYKNQRIDYHE